MKNILCFLILSVACSTGALAQMLLPPSAYEMREAFDFHNYNREQILRQNQDLTESDIEGTPFLNDDFIKGSVFTTSKVQYVDVPLRYNIYTDQVEFKNSDGEVYAIAAPEVIEKVEYADYQIEYIPYLTGKKIKRGFFTVLEKGKASLYIRPQVIFEGAKKPGAYQDAQPAKFIRRSDNYFIRIDMEPAQMITKKKDLTALLSQHTNEVNAFIKKQNVKPNDLASLAELIKYYNSL